MGSSWMGLGIGASALQAAQQQLDTAAHNVANVNTPGYSRQRVRLVASQPYTYPSFNRSGIPGQVGTGVTISSISRVRDAFLDLQIQAQSTLEGGWSARRDELTKIEAVFPEPSDSGLGSVISKYWSAWQDVAADPTSTAARATLTEQSAALAGEFNRDSLQLKMMAEGIDGQVTSAVQTINDLASQLADLNGQIQRVRVTGDNPNDLLDQRDAILGQLSELVPVTQVAQQDGTLTVLIGGTDLVAGVNARKMSTQTSASGHVVPVWPTGDPVALRNGKLQALLTVRDTDIAGYQAQLDSLAKGIADSTNTIQQRGIDMTGNAGLPLFTYQAGNVAQSLAVNSALAADPRLVAAAAQPGASGDGTVAGLIADLQDAWSYVGGSAASNVVGGTNLSTGVTARLMTIAAGRAKAQTYTFSSAGGNSLTLTGTDGSFQTITVPDLAAGSTGTLNFDQLGIKLTISSESGLKNGADVVTDLTAGGHNTLVVSSLFTPPQTTAEFYSGIVGKVGADTSQATEMASNQQLVVDQLNQRIEQYSGVSLDEEATDMIRFQHAYSAAARVITTIDEMLNTLINGTGLVGR